MNKSIKDILPLILGQSTNWRIRLLHNWHSIWGSLSDKVKLVKIESNTIVIGVYDSCWLQELHLMSDLLLHTINKTIGDEKIKKIRFQNAYIKNNKKKKPAISPIKKPSSKSFTLEHKEQQALNSINDPQLNIALKNFLKRCNLEN